MPNTFWLEEYQQKAAMDCPIAQSGRGNRFDPVSCLHVARQVISLLQPQCNHALLDIGCGNGLMDIVLSACCRTIVCVEPVQALVERARANLCECPGASVQCGSGAAVPADNDEFDRVVIYSATQLIPPDELEATFDEIVRVARPGARILIGDVLNAARRTEFRLRYEDGLRSATHLSTADKDRIMRRHRQTYWYNPGELCRRFTAHGATTKVVPLPAADPNATHRFHLVATLGGG